MRRSDNWNWSAIAFVVFAAVLGTAASRYASRLLDQIDGEFGYRPNPAGVKEFLKELDRPLFSDAGKEVIEGAKGKDAYLYRYADKAHRKVYGKPFGPLNQGQIGTCTGFGWSTGSFVGQSVDWFTGGLAEPPLLVSPEALYAGSRTWGRMPPVLNGAGYSDGSYGAACARWVAGRCKDPAVGGILYRQKYGDIDLTEYSVSRAKAWGNSGPPRDLAVEANKHTAKAIALCDSWQGLASALESGMPVVVCSNVGFASGNRDADGFCSRASTWNHCMVAISIKYAKNNGPGSATPMKNPRDGVLLMNSWGSYLGGGKHPADQPDGSFYITRADAEAIIAQGDSFVIGSVQGFKYRDLEHREWLTPPPESVSKKSPNVNHALAL
jgi:hypothetical protein